MSIYIKEAACPNFKISEFIREDFEKSNTKKLNSHITPNRNFYDDFTFEMPSISIVVDSNKKNKFNSIFNQNKIPSMDQKNDINITQTNPRELLDSYNYEIVNFAKNNNLEKCLDVVKKIKNKNLIPTSHSYAPILNIFANKNDKIGALSFFKEVIGEGFKPNSVVYNTLIKFYHNNPSSFLKELREIIGEDDVHIYDALILHYVNNNNPEKVDELYNKIKESGLQPSICTYNSMLNLCVKQKDVKKSDELKKLIDESSLIPTWETYNFLINLHVKFDNENNISSLFKEMKDKKITIPSTVYTTLMNFYGRLNNKEKVFELFKEIERVHLKWDLQICNVYIDLLLKYDKKTEAKQFFNLRYNIDDYIIPSDPEINMPEKLNVHGLSHGAAYFALQLFVREKWNKQPFSLVTGKGIHSTKNDPYAMSNILMEKLNENEFAHLAYKIHKGHLNVFLATQDLSKRT